MSVYLDDGDAVLHHGDALATLRTMPSASVHCIVTSPPFWALRDYGVDGQIGLEASPDEWCAALVAVFREARRVLRPDGVAWIECGDTYNGGGMGGGPKSGKLEGSGKYRVPGDEERQTTTRAPGLKSKDLVGAPWLLAFALRADGWYLRSDTIWARPNPMPESVTDRPTKAHSYVFLLSREPRYFYDADAIREQSSANTRSVWTIRPEATSFAHFATFPQELVSRCILSGTSEHGCCGACGAPWTRTSERVDDHPDVSRDAMLRAKRAAELGAFHGSPVKSTLGSVPAWQSGAWAASCACNAAVEPCTVLDPFAGSATTLLVARRHGRRSVGIELSAEYLAIAATRLQQLSLLGGDAA